MKNSKTYKGFKSLKQHFKMYNIKYRYRVTTRLRRLQERRKGL